MKESREIAKGRAKSYIDKGEYLVKELQKVLKKYPEISQQMISDALVDPNNSEAAENIGRNIRLIKEEISSLDNFKEKSRRRKDLEKLLKQKEEQLRNLNESHKNKTKLDSLPDDVKEKITEVRDYIDALSQMLIDSGLLSDKLSITYSENKGIYLTRSYKAHQQTKPTGWAAGLKKSFSEKIFGKQFQDLESIKRNHKLYNRAKDFFRKQIFNSMPESEKVRRKISKPEDVPEYEVDEIIGEILDPVGKDSPAVILSKVGPSLRRYLKEEMGFVPPMEKLNPLDTYQSKDNGFKYYTYVIVTPKEFIPTLNDESNGYAWIKIGHYPKPLHNGAKITLGNEKNIKKFYQILDQN